MTDKTWTLSVTNSVASFETDDTAPGRPIRCIREITVVLKRRQMPKADPEIVNVEQMKRFRHARSQRWMERIVIGLWIYGVTVIALTAVFDQALGIERMLGAEAETWMYSAFIALFGSLPLFVESGKDPF